MPDRKDPHLANRFLVSVDGLPSGWFTEASGLSMTSDVFEIKEGGLNAGSHKFLNRSTCADVVLKKGFISDLDLFNWFKACAKDSWTPRKNGTVVLRNKKGQTLATWKFFRAFPTKWDGPTFNASSSAIAIQSVTLACEWIDLEVPGTAPNPEI